MKRNIITIINFHSSCGDCYPTVVSKLVRPHNPTVDREQLPLVRALDQTTQPLFSKALNREQFKQRRFSTYLSSSKPADLLEPNPAG